MKRGEIYLVDLGPGVGREASSVRYVVVISNDVSNLAPMLVTVVPTVDASDLTAALGVLVTANESGLPVDVAVLPRQPRAIDPSRFPAQPAGAVPAHLLKAIGFALVVELDLPP